MIAYVLGFFLATWETQKEFLNAGSALVQPWLLEAWEQWIGRWKIDLSLSPSLITFGIMAVMDEN